MASSAGDRRDGVDLVALLRSGASVMSLCIAALAGPAYAQEVPSDPTEAAEEEADDNESLEQTAGQVQSSDDIARPGAIATTANVEESTAQGGEIVVTGLRQSLANSQNIKRNADTVVDAITAEDIGALPDRSVTEALQRVPGVAITRFAAGNDPDHFSVEGSGVVVRGLNFVRSEFNGRDAFTVSSGRALGFSDVPAELLGSVEVYKNVTAEMIEGGLAGTVNLNTRLPFDNRGLHVGFSAEANYGDLAKEWTPVGSLLVSNTWETGFGTIGLLGSLSYSRLKSRADGMQVTNFQTRDGAVVRNSNDDADVTRTQLPGMDLAYAPVGPSFRTQEFDRKRFGISAAGQWESLDRTMLLTAQYVRAKAKGKTGEYTIESAGDLSEYNTFPAGCGVGDVPTNCPEDIANYQYDEDNIFESGFITLPGTGWRSFDSGQATTRVPTGGIQQALNRRMDEEETLTIDHSLNFKWAATDRLSFNFDAQYVKAETESFSMGVHGSTFADAELDLTGDIPVAELHRPLNLAASWASPNPEMAAATDETWFTDPQWTFWRSAMDHAEENDGTEWAFKADAAYDLQEIVPFVRRVKFGARYADRDQTVRYSRWNWGSLSEIWSGSGPAVYMDQTDADAIDFYEFGNFFRGDTPGPVGGWFYGGDLIEDYDQAVDFLQGIQEQSIAAGGISPSWVPLAGRPGVVSGTDFLPGEISTVSERTNAAYAMLSFGSDEPVFGGITVDGNVGIRFVNTKVRSLGSLQFPDVSAIGSGDPFEETCDATPVDPDGEGPLGPQPPDLPAVCDLGAEAYAAAQQFATNESFASSAVHEYDNWLPSLNVKFGLTDSLIARFAASKVMTRPEMGYIRNFVTIGTGETEGGFAFTADSGNPFLKPATAYTFDLGLEWYFARVGSLTGALFYKKINNFFWSNVTNREVTNNGVTQNVLVRGPANFSEDDGVIKGFELAYQQTFDFLPGLLSGFGVNANYTYIQSKGIPNTALNATEPGGIPREPETGVSGNLPLEGLSKHNYNLTGFYEKGPLSLRLSYSWRSKFLLTVRDVIWPYYPIYNEATGQLDGSLFYSINDKLKLGVQAVNLGNEVTRTSQVFTATGLQAPRSYFVNDRRFSLILRGNF